VTHLLQSSIGQDCPARDMERQRSLVLGNDRGRHDQQKWLLILSLEPPVDSGSKVGASDLPLSKTHLPERCAECETPAPASVPL
jgi:hypothetical protein